MQTVENNQLMRIVVEKAYRDFERRLCVALARCYPSTPRSHRKDAVADAFVVVLERPHDFYDVWQRGGDEALYRLLHCIAWRHLRGYHRKKSTRSEIACDVEDWCSYGPTPERIVAGRQKLSQVDQLADRAAVRFGASRAPALRAALETRFGGANDTEAARMHGVPREYVNRARRWIGAQVM